MDSRIALIVLLIIGAVCLLMALPSNATKFSECDSGKVQGKIASVQINDCPDSDERCIFKRGTTKTVEMKFTPNVKIQTARVSITGKVVSSYLPFPVSPDDACANYGVNCPLEAGKEQTFKMSLPVMMVYPRIKVDVILKLLDQDKKTIVCAQIPANIQ